MVAAAPCLNKPIFTNPKPFHPDTFDALEMCEHCPLRKQCALDALNSGDSLDQLYRRPATGVIQAGVICDGNQATATALAHIAGIPAPNIHTSTRYQPPAMCKGCGKPMTARIKGIPLDASNLTHAAHGYCRICDAKRRRSKDWQSATPKHSALFAWKEKHGSVPTKRASHPSPDRPVDNRPPGHPPRTQGEQAALF